MATKKTPTPRDAALADVLACATSAQMARVLGVQGKTLRNFVRGTLGVYVNDGADGAKHAGSRTSLTDDDKRAVFDRFYKEASA